MAYGCGCFPGNQTKQTSRRSLESCTLFRLIRPRGWRLVTGRRDVVAVDPWDEGFGTSQSNGACVISAGVLAQSLWQAAVRLQILIFYNVVLVFEWMDLKSCPFVTGAAVWSLSWGQMTGSHQSSARRKGGGGVCCIYVLYYAMTKAIVQTYGCVKLVWHLLWSPPDVCWLSTIECESVTCV